MRRSCQWLVVVFLGAVLPGCVTSRYANDQGFECTRRYFTPLGITTHSCSETVRTAPASPVGASGEEVKVASSAPAPSLRQTTPAKTIEQNIRATTRVR